MWSMWWRGCSTSSRTTRALPPRSSARGTRPRHAAQCQHVRSVAVTRIEARIGNVGPVVLGEIRETLALLLDL